jgi:two-component system response regulator MprA
LKAVLPPSQTQADSQPHRLLVVDDDCEVRTALAGVLSQEGYLVETAMDGYQALAALHRHPPDVVLLDLLMPGMDGFELLAELRRERLSIEPKIIVVTTSRGFTARDLGVAAVVSKPFDVDRLIGTIKAVVPTRAPS